MGEISYCRQYKIFMPNVSTVLQSSSAAMNKITNRWCTYSFKLISEISPRSFSLLYASHAIRSPGYVIVLFSSFSSCRYFEERVPNFANLISSLQICEARSFPDFNPFLDQSSQRYGSSAKILTPW